jgi:hypothetical protein
MSDADTLAEIERHNVMCWERFRDYWRKQGVNIALSDPTKPITATGSSLVYRAGIVVRMRFA